MNTFLLSLSPLERLALFLVCVGAAVCLTVWWMEMRDE